jgi:hypothetical protein
MSVHNSIMGSRNFNAGIHHSLHIAPKKTKKDLLLDRLIKGEDICIRQERDIRKYVQDYKKMGIPIYRLNCNDIGCDIQHKHGAYYFEWAEV